MGQIFLLLKLVWVLVFAVEANRGPENTRLKTFVKDAHDGAAQSALYHHNQYRGQGLACNFTGWVLAALQIKQENQNSSRKYPWGGSLAEGEYIR